MLPRVELEFPSVAKYSVHSGKMWSQCPVGRQSSFSCRFGFFRGGWGGAVWLVEGLGGGLCHLGSESVKRSG